MKKGRFKRFYILCDSTYRAFCTCPRGRREMRGRRALHLPSMRTVLSKTLVLASHPPTWYYHSAPPRLMEVLSLCHSMLLPPTSRLPNLPGSTCSKAISSPQNQNHHSRNVLQFCPVLAGKTPDLCY